MAGAGPIYGGLGAAALPLAAGDISDTELAFVDQAQQLLLDLLAAAINYELTDAWTKVCASLPPDSKLVGSTAPVGSKWRLAPTKEHLSETAVSWPILSVTRTGESEAGFFTVDTRTIRQKWDVSWMLGPVGLAESSKLQGALAYFFSIVDRTIAQKGHVAYESGELVLASESSPFLAVEVFGLDGGFVRVDEDGPQILAATVKLDAIERFLPTLDHLSAIDGVKLREHLASPDGANITDFVVDDTTGTPDP